MKNKTSRWAFLWLGALLCWAPARADAPNLMTYQGRLKESGLPVTGNRTIDIQLCALASGGACNSTGAQGVAVSNGLYRTTFTPSVDLSNGPWYVEVHVGALALSPREQLTSSPYALMASSAASVAAGAVGAAQVVPGTFVRDIGDTMTGQLNMTNAAVSLTGASGNVVGQASVTASGFFGNGAGLTGITAATNSNTFGSSVTVASGGIDVTGAVTLRASSPLTSLSSVTINAASLFTGVATFTSSATHTASDAGATGLIVKGAVGQVGALQNWQNSSGVALASVTATGVFTGNGSGLTGITAATNSNTFGSSVTVASGGLDASGAVTLRAASPLTSLSSVTVASGGLDVTGGSTLRAASPLTSLSSVTINAAALFASSATFTVNDAGATGLIVKGAAGQVGALQNWQNSAGVALASVTAAGVFTGNGSGLTGIAAATNSNTFGSSVTVASGGLDATGAVTLRAASPLTSLSSVTVNAAVLFTSSATHTANDAGATGLIVKGAAGQVGALQNWQNSSGVALASVTAAGVFTGNGSGLTNVTAASNSNTFGSSVTITSGGIDLTGGVTLRAASPLTSLSSVTVNGWTLLSNMTNTGSLGQQGAATFTSSVTFNGIPALTAASNVGIGTTAPGERLEVNGNLKFSGPAQVFAATASSMTIHGGDGPASGGALAGALTLRGGNAGATLGGGGGDLTLQAGGNTPQGGSGYTNLGPTGLVYINAAGGYNTVGGSVTIKAGNTSCFTQPANQHSDIYLSGGIYDATPAIGGAANLFLKGGFSAGNGGGASCTALATGGDAVINAGGGEGGGNGGNVIMSAGAGNGAGVNGTIQLNSNVTINASTLLSTMTNMGSLGQQGAATFTSSVTINAPTLLSTMTNTGSLGQQGTATFTSSVTVNAPTLLSTMTNTGSLGQQGAATFTSSVTFNGNPAFTAASNVGIQTTSPQNLLHVDGAGSTTTGDHELIAARSSFGSGPAYAGISIGYSISGGQAQGGIIRSLNALPMMLGNTSNPTALNIAANGNVGLGTTSPGINLSFGNSADQTFGIESSAASNPGRSLVIRAGDGGPAGAGAAGGNIIVQPGAANGTGNNAAGLIALNLAGPTGTGAAGYVDIHGTGSGASHLRSSQPTGPSVSVPSTCGTSPSATVSGTDMAGKLTITTGNGVTGGPPYCLATVTFNQPYGGTPKVVFVLPADNNAQFPNLSLQTGANAPSSTSFKVQMSNAPASQTAYSYYYLVIE